MTRGIKKSYNDSDTKRYLLFQPVGAVVHLVRPPVEVVAGLLVLLAVAAPVVLSAVLQRVRFALQSDSDSAQVAHQVGEPPEQGGHQAQSRVGRRQQTYPRAQAGGTLGCRGPLVVGLRPAAVAAGAATATGKVTIEVFWAVGAELVGRVEVAAEVGVQAEVVESLHLKTIYVRRLNMKLCSISLTCDCLDCGLLRSLMRCCRCPDSLLPPLGRYDGYLTSIGFVLVNPKMYE